jgi:hypothetical protein
MKTVSLVEAMDYPEDVPQPLSNRHAIICEIVSRLQELDELGSTDGLPNGARLANRISAIYRKTPRGYRLVLDLLSRQQSLSDSLHTLASRHLNSQGMPCKRQAWLQNAQEDVEIIKSIYPELGKVMAEVLKRRPNE